MRDLTHRHDVFDIVEPICTNLRDSLRIGCPVRQPAVCEGDRRNQITPGLYICCIEPFMLAVKD